MKSEYQRIITKCILSLLVLFAVGAAYAQQPANEAAESEMVDPGSEVDSSDYVTINVKDANIAEVLKAYSLQTGQSIVVGPDVVCDNVNVRLNNIPWEDALDVILKPYGFGYQVIGDTIVISKLENIVTVEGIEPLASEVFALRFLDAYDVKDIVEAQLTGRGRFTILSTRSLPGWQFGGSAGGASGAAVEAGIRARKKKEDIQKSKLFVVTDVPATITKIAKIIEKMDTLPAQVLIEAKFLEISTDGLSDIGLDYITAMENVQQLGTAATSPDAVALESSPLKVLNMSAGYPNPLNTGASGGYSQNSGIRLSHSVLDDWGADMLFAFIQQDGDANVLSAPRVLTLNNQEAAILVGEKFPIIESQNNSGSGSSITSTRLDYYENIGIQLNVIPQVCADDYINMIVHPAVSEIAGFESGVVTAGSGTQSGTQYPRLKIREAETQIMIKGDKTAVIGGLQTERDKEIIKKVPLLGDIPFLGRLFRRETLTKEKIDLLIFIKASVVDNDAYAEDSKAREARHEDRMKLDLIEERKEPGAENPDVDLGAVNKEMLELVGDPNADTKKSTGTEKAKK